MSIFSKLFPGGAGKGEEEASSPSLPAVGDGEEGPPMKRPPNDGRPPPSDGRTVPTPARTEAQPQKAPATHAGQTGTAAQRQSIRTTQVGPGSPGVRAAPAPVPAPAPPQGVPAAATRPTPRSAPDAPPPRATGAHVAPGTVPQIRVTVPSPSAVAPQAVTPAVSPMPPAVAPRPAEAANPQARARQAPPAVPQSAANAGVRAVEPQTIAGPPVVGVAPVILAAPKGSDSPSHAAAKPPMESSMSAPARAPATEMNKPNGAHSIAETFERLLGSEVDAGFASLERAPSIPEPTASSPIGAAAVDYAEVRHLFAELAANHVRPVRDFMIDLRWCDATVDWLPICEPALSSLRRAAERLELGTLCEALDRFSEAITAAQSSDVRTIGGDLRASLLARYEDLIREMPQAFALDLDRSQREGVILQSLLLQVADVKKVTLDKMYAAGLSTLDAMLLATPADIAATTGIAEELAERIVLRFRAYHDQVKATAPDAARLRERERIAALTALLRREHDAYERAAQSWSESAMEEKKLHRKARAQALLDIQVELARLGEVERLARLERLPFDGKLTQLESFLEDARDKYVTQL